MENSEKTKYDGNHILKKMYDSVKSKHDTTDPEDANKHLHAELITAYATSVYGVMNKIVVPTPLFRVNYEEGNLGIEDNFGFAQVPSDTAVDINALDLLLACQIRGIPLLLKGDTGIGKTHTTEAFYETVLDGKGQFISMRLNDNSMGGNDILIPFKERYKDTSEMRKSRVDKKATKSCAAMFIDEVNLAINPSAVMAVEDGKINIGATQDKLGPYVPAIDDNGMYFDEKRMKTSLVFAMNPAGDKFAGTSNLSAALENRAIIYYFPNSVCSTGATFWLPEGIKDGHEKFMNAMAERISKQLGLDKKELEKELEENWLDVYSYMIDPKKSEKNPLHSAMEFDDLMGFLISIDQTKNPTLRDLLESEEKISKAWNSKLGKKYGVNFNLTGGINENVTTNKYSDLVLNSMREPLEPRDKAQIKRVADAVMTIRQLKEVFCEDNPLEAYLNLDTIEDSHTKGYLTLEDFASAYTFLVKSKRTVEELEVAELVNNSVNTYIELEEAFSRAQEIPLTEKFVSTDVRRGIKNMAVTQALFEAIELSKENNSYNNFSEYIIKGLSKQINILNSVNSASSPTIGKVMIGKISSDLSTLAGFIHQYHQKIDAKAEDIETPKDIFSVSGRA